VVARAHSLRTQVGLVLERICASCARTSCMGSISFRTPPTFGLPDNVIPCAEVVSGVPLLVDATVGERAILHAMSGSPARDLLDVD
jgi:hypothetical protein